jgi:tetratricopeptide (TPR) repeat protein
MSHDIEYLDKSVQAHNLFGLALMNASQQSNYTQPEAFEMKQKAIGEFKKSIELYPNFFNAQFDIGRVYVELGDFKTAHNEFKKAYMLDKTSTLALEEMVKSAFEARLHQDVLNYGKQYLKENAPNELIYELVAYSCLLNQDFNNCSEIATKGAKLFPENVNLNRMVIDSKNKVIVK